jgi:hypothetical protein
MILDGAECPRFIANRCPRSMRSLLGTRGRGTTRASDGPLLIAGISLGKRRGFDLEGNPLAVFDHFEIVWPLDFADMISGPKSDQQN